MTPERFEEIAARIPALRLAVVGDFCLDRYLEIDPEREEVSIETGLAVHNIVRVRNQPGAAGTILANLSALGVGELHPVFFCGRDGEGFEMWQALKRIPGVKTRRMRMLTDRSTFTYMKPLVVHPGSAPRELNRLDIKNSLRTPADVESILSRYVFEVAGLVDAMVVMDQVPVAGTGVATERVLATVGEVCAARPTLPVIADSRRSLRGFPPVIWKMNAAELALLAETADEAAAVSALAERNGRAVFATLAERGMLGAEPGGTVEHVPACAVHGPIDIVGAGDAVTANLVVALAAGATLREAMELAMAAASIVIHQLGTTGTASVAQLRALLVRDGLSSPE